MATDFIPTVQQNLGGQQQVMPATVMDPRMRRQAVISNLAENLMALGRRGPIVNPAQAMDAARQNQMNLAIQQESINSRQAQEAEAARLAEINRQRQAAVQEINRQYMGNPQAKFTALVNAGFEDEAKAYADTLKASGLQIFPDAPSDTRPTVVKTFAESYPQFVNPDGTVKDDDESTAAFRDYEMALKKGGASNITQTVDTGKQMGMGAKKFHEEAAQGVNQWLSTGRSNAFKNMSQLESVMAKFQSGQNLTGGVIGFTPDAILAYTNADAQAAKEDVQQVVSESLKEILGAQFTEKEGERLLARAYNPKLSEEQNAKKVYRLLKQIRIAADAKDKMAKYFLDNNYSMEGWNYFDEETPSIADFYFALDDESLDPAEPAPAAPGNFTPSQSQQSILNKYLSR